jgi:hypothetical protein
MQRIQPLSVGKELLGLLFPSRRSLAIGADKRAKGAGGPQRRHRRGCQVRQDSGICAIRCQKTAAVGCSLDYIEFVTACDEVKRDLHRQTPFRQPGDWQKRQRSQRIKAVSSLRQLSLSAISDSPRLEIDF